MLGVKESFCLYRLCSLNGGLLSKTTGMCGESASIMDCSVIEMTDEGTTRMRAVNSGGQGEEINEEAGADDDKGKVEELGDWGTRREDIV